MDQQFVTVPQPQDQTPSPPTPRRKKERFAGIDIVKIFACFLVAAVHFFLHTEFYTTPLISFSSAFPVYVRWFAFCCVPLFMITTGYLMKNKTLSAKYYLGILRVLVLYIVISLLCVAFNAWRTGTKFQFFTIIRGLFMYTDAQYAWYVEYYFAIFAIIPFLNAAYHSMQHRGQKRILLLTVIMITVLSPSFYIGFEESTQMRVFPGYFYRCYPIAYYYIGAYIREYPPKHENRRKLLYMAVFLAGLVWISLATIYQTLHNEAGNYVWHSWHYDDYASWPVVLCSTMLFLLLFDIPCRNATAARILQILSNATFAAYLISYIFDMMVYDRLRLRVGDVTERFRYAPLTVTAVFICSMAAGVLLQGAYDLGEQLVHRLCQNISRKRKDAET